MTAQPTAAPLAGVRVLDFTQLLPGGHAGMVLADFGASVIKVEPPTGDPMRRVAPRLPSGDSARHHVLGRGKYSYVADLKDPARRQNVVELARDADVVLESFRPGVMDRLGLGYGDLSALNSRLVYVSLSGYGAAGARAAQPSHDLNFLALSGLLAPPNRSTPPKLPPVQVGDLAGGSLQAVIGVLLALRSAEATGVGQHVDVAMLDGLLSLMACAVADASADPCAVPTGGRLGGGFACYGTYSCRDGYIAVGALEAKFWKAMTMRIGLEELAEVDHLDPAAQSHLRERLADRFARLSVAEAMVTVGDDVCVTPVRSMTEVLGDGDLVRRGALEPGNGAHPAQPGVQPRLSAYATAVPSPGEALGASNALIDESGWQACART